MFIKGVAASVLTPRVLVPAAVAGIANAESQPAEGHHLGYDHSCTGWVAQRLAQLGIEVPRGLGDAGSWFDACRWPKSPRSITAYAIACWRPLKSKVGHVGHVALVEWSRADGTIDISEAGWNDQPYERLVHRDHLSLGSINAGGRGEFAGFLIHPRFWLRAQLGANGFHRLGSTGFYPWVAR
jgi:surface antigen